VSSFKIISGTWRFFRDVGLHDAFTSPNGNPIQLSHTSPGTPNALNSNDGRFSQCADNGLGIDAADAVLLE
jgi:hypothetical protein